MNPQTPEMMSVFRDELSVISGILEPIAEKLRINPNQPPLYQEFGQVIDRVYGTAATLGLKEVAEYCRSMKTLTYKCSQTHAVHSMSQVRDMVLVSVQLIKKVQQITNEPNQIKKIQYTLQKERERAEEISRKLLGAIKRTSLVT